MDYQPLGKKTEKWKTQVKIDQVLADGKNGTRDWKTFT